MYVCVSKLTRMRITRQLTSFRGHLLHVPLFVVISVLCLIGGVTAEYRVLNGTPDHRYIGTDYGGGKVDQFCVE